MLLNVPKQRLAVQVCDTTMLNSSTSAKYKNSPNSPLTCRYRTVANREMNFIFVIINQIKPNGEQQYG